MIQYPKLKHVTLPSIDGAFGTLNILRDPPKSIHTRYIEKVGDTNKITRQIDHASDRICESILPFARGQNAMVDVNYSNFGNNAGQSRQYVGSFSANGNTSLSANLPQAKLPYRIMRDGAFRPPVRPPQDLLPLSRLPRNSTNMTLNPSTKRVFNRISCKPDKRTIREQLLNVCVPSRAAFNIGQPASKPYEIKYSINENNIQGMMHTNVSAGNGNVALETNKTPISSINNNRTYTTITAPASKNISTPAIESCIGNQPMPTKDTLSGNYSTNASVSTNCGLMQGKQKVLGRNIPLGSMHTNTTINGDITNQQLQRKYTYLPERRSRGSFCNGGITPSIERPEIAINRPKPSEVKSLAANLAAGHHQQF